MNPEFAVCVRSNATFKNIIAVPGKLNVNRGEFVTLCTLVVVPGVNVTEFPEFVFALVHLPNADSTRQRNTLAKPIIRLSPQSLTVIDNQITYYATQQQYNLLGREYVLYVK